MSFLEKVRAFRMGLAQLATELGLALIVIAILIGGIASGIFFSVNASQQYINVSGIANNTMTWDVTSKLVWPYIFPLCLAALLIGILYHMYRTTQE